ncbi:MAG: permease [Methylocella sp.]
MFKELLDALGMAFAMGWEILWPLALGFALSAVIQAIVSHREMSRLLPNDSPRSIGIALALGAASSSCSYAAVAIARSIFRKGANFTAAMAFEMASTNLVLELSIILIVLLGWHFMVAEAIAAPIMVTILILLFRMFLRPQLVRAAKDQAEKGIAGRMEGHAEMDMSVPAEGPLWQRIMSDNGLTAISHYFVMDWAAVWMDIVGGLVIAGAIAAWVPQDFWKAFFLIDHPVLATLWGPLVGPLVAIIAFVCSVGNVPLAAVLWNGGISFGGVLAFILADLIVPPILNIYRKYYGLNMAAFLLVTFYVAMAAAALAVEGLFGSLGLILHERQARVVEASITWNYTTWLNIGFLFLAALLVWRFVTTGGIEMLQMMNKPACGDETRHHPHCSSLDGVVTSAN